jgi:hypothetical protein
MVLEFYRVQDSLAAVQWMDSSASSVVVGAWSRVLRFLAFRPNVRRFVGISCISICDYGGAVGIEAKWTWSSIAAQADSLGFCLCSCTMLTLMMHCSNSRYPDAMEKDGGREAVIDLKHGLYVWAAFSVGVKHLSGAVYCRSVFWLAINSLTLLEVSLSMR